MKSVLVGALATLAGLVALQALLAYIRRNKAATEGIRYENADRGTVLQMIQMGRRIQETKAIRNASGVSIEEALEIVKKVETGDIALLERYLPSQR